VHDDARAAAGAIVSVLTEIWAAAARTSDSVRCEAARGSR
jgi:hypothetical protein